MSEKAVKWLEDPSIQNASRERKVAFLLGKGVARDDIDRLLPKKTTQQTQPAQEELKTVHARQGADKAAPQVATQSATTTAQVQLPRRDIPPVITYPEFLLQPQEKPPIVTTQRLINTAYIAGGLAATIYGLSQYVIAPMAESLTSARLTFMQHTSEQIDELNSRLEKTVSKLPPTVTSHTSQQQHDGDEPPSPTDSDPSELFHRDIGTQTSPVLSRPSTPTSSTAAAEPTSLSILHESRIRSLKEHVAALRTSSDAHTDGSLLDLKTTVNELSQYLTDTSYNSPYYGIGYANGMDGSSGSFVAGGADAAAKDNRDAVDALKAEIRSVKGVLLSARNFPAGKPMAPGR